MNSDMSPVFVFVPGGWHPTDYLEPMRDYLHENGFDSVAVSHRTLESINPGSSIFDDAEKLENVVKQLINTGNDVILVMHSYGGIVGSQAIGHLLSDSSVSNGSSCGDETVSMGKILYLVYVAAVIPQEGETIADVGKLVAADSDSKERLPVEIVAGNQICKEGVKELFYGDLLESERNKYYDLLQPWPATLLQDATTRFGWKHVPSTYVCATNDFVMPIKSQVRIRDRVNKILMLEPSSLIASSASGQASNSSSGDAFDGDQNRVPGLMSWEVIDSDHCSMFILREHVELLGSMLIRLVKQ